jgi:hypothetical protein
LTAERSIQNQAPRRSTCVAPPRHVTCAQRHTRGDRRSAHRISKSYNQVHKSAFHSLSLLPSLIPTTMADPSPFARLPLQRSESRSSLAPPSPLAAQYPHVYHYVHHLFQSAAAVPEATTTKEAHPLSVSSSTGSGSGSGSNSDEERDAKPHESAPGKSKSARTVSVSSAASGVSAAPSTDTQGSGTSQKVPSLEEKEETIRAIVELLGEEKEEQVKDVLKDKLGAIGQVSSMMPCVVQVLMVRRTMRGWTKSAWISCTNTEVRRTPDPEGTSLTLFPFQTTWITSPTHPTLQHAPKPLPSSPTPSLTAPSHQPVSPPSARAPRSPARNPQLHSQEAASSANQALAQHRRIPHREHRRLRMRRWRIPWRS